MSDCKKPAPLSACQILDQALEAVHEAARGEAVQRIRVRDTDTEFQESTLASRMKYLQSLVMNAGVFGRCRNFGLAQASAGIPMGRSPAYAVFGRREFAQDCGCGPVNPAPSPIPDGEGDCCE